jgi:hypothetical protein
MNGGWVLCGATSIVSRFSLAIFLQVERPHMPISFTRLIAILDPHLFNEEQ